MIDRAEVKTLRYVAAVDNLYAENLLVRVDQLFFHMDF